MSSDASSHDLLSFVGSVAGEFRLRVEEDLGKGYVVLRVSEAERRQAQHDIQRVEDVVIELLRNARDANAEHIYVAISKEADIRTIVVIDDGSGVPEELRERIFDARVTSKLDNFHLDRWGVHGRGMALFSIRQNAQAAYVAQSQDALGTSLVVSINTQSVPERADQSKWPQLSFDDEGEIQLVKGPHNIVRTCAEFALEEKDRCELYLGSPAEILACMVARNDIDTGDITQLFAREESLALIDRPALATNAAELADIADKLGLEISQRNAQRVLSGEIEPLTDVYSLLFKKAPSSIFRPKKQLDITRDYRGLRIAKSDLEEFKEKLAQDFEMICERYYLEAIGEPQVHLRNNRLSVSFDFEKTD
ncbi:MAG: ATP-binding protein [Atopobiaceae bacterium]|nr:ATP-binding protein [Atopobiaceae bacterium]